MNAVRMLASALLSIISIAAIAQPAPVPTYFPVVRGAHPHDVAASREPGGPVYYTAQATGKLGILDPATGKVEEVALGRQLRAARRHRRPRRRAVDHRWRPERDRARRSEDARGQAVGASVVGVERQPQHADVRSAGRVWFTGQSGYYGRVDPASGDVKVWRAPRGRGPYGITTTPSGDVYYASLAGNHIARIDVETGEATVIEPPTRDQGARRVWSDSQGNIWVELLEYRAGRPLRSRDEGVARMEAARQRACVLGVGRSRRQRVADRLVGQRHRAIRPANGEVHGVSVRSG